MPHTQSSPRAGATCTVRGEMQRREGTRCVLCVHITHTHTSPAHCAHCVCACKQGKPSHACCAGGRRTPIHVHCCPVLFVPDHFRCL